MLCGLAAVPVINADVHFRSAILTEKQARQGVDFSVPVWPFDRRVFQYALHVFKYLPLAFVYIVVSFIPVMLRGLEVHHIAAILLPC